MKISFKTLMMACAVACSVGLTSCEKEDPKGKESNGGYGSLNGNLITIGSTRDVTYTNCVLLGTVDFPKITSDHSYGVVYMEALVNPDFDYEGKLIYGGHSGKNDKEDYDCIDIPVRNSSADGKFEKQLVDLKPNTTYYYRAYVKIGGNENYSKVEKFTTKDPSPEITMVTTEPTDIFAVAGTMNGVVNVGKLQDVNENQAYGFVYATAPQLSEADKLTYEYYQEWVNNHFETEDEFEGPKEVTVSTNMNGRITYDMPHLKPGTSYYYRTFFKWNGKYFYSPEVKTMTTLGSDEITVGTSKATEVTHNSATLNATVPFSLIGLESVEAGFMISKVYSNASEFNMDEAEEWEDRNYNPDAKVFFVEKEIAEKDFSIDIDGLSAETTYYVCAYISLGSYDDKDLYIYGPIQEFKTDEAVNAPVDPSNPDADFYAYGEGAYPWSLRSDGYWESTNKGLPGTTSILKVDVRHKAGDTIEFFINVSSEQNYDYLNILNGNTVIATYSGSYTGTHRIECYEDGVSNLTFQYHKDGSNDVGSDRAVVGNFYVERAGSGR